MNGLCGAAVLAVALGFASPATAASEVDCRAMWSKADATNSGYISGKEASIYMDAMQANGRATVALDRIAAEEFMAACLADVFKNAST
jgi:hypothetical protein